MASSEETSETELQLALASSLGPDVSRSDVSAECARSNFFSEDIKGECQRIKVRGGVFVMPTTDIPGATIASLNDNLIQITQLRRR